MEAKLLTPAQAAQVLQLNIETVYSLLRKGELPGRKIGGSWRIDARRLYEEAGRVHAEAA